MRARALAVLAAVAIVIYALDQLSKVWVVENLELGVPHHVLGSLLTVQFVKNPGAAFSMASGATWVFSIIAAVVTVFIVWFAPRIRSVGWAVMFGLLLGGVLGNLTDRLMRDPGFGVGHVIDFLQIPLLPAIFNVADMGIVFSMGLFLILSIRGVALDGTRHVKPGHRHQKTARADDGTVLADDGAVLVDDRPVPADDRPVPAGDGTVPVDHGVALVDQNSFDQDRFDPDHPGKKG